MAVTVVDVGGVPMLVLHGTGRMRMAVRLRPLPALVRMLVVIVVDVHVDVGACGVTVSMQVALVDQEPCR